MSENGSADRLAKLMQAAQAGDRGSYIQVLTEITPRLRRIVRRYRRFQAVDEIEDLVQDILLSVHAVRANYDPERPLMPWLLAIARHRLIDSARRHARRAAHEVVVDDLAVTFSNERANINIGTSGDPEALRAAIEALPPGQRSAIEMLKLREMSLKEAALASGIRVGALKVASHRGMQALRKALTKMP